MNIRKSLHLYTLMIASCVMIFQYQNCAPAKKDAQTNLYDPDSNPPTIIDDVNKETLVSFPQKTVTVQQDVDAAIVDGVCAESQSGAVLRWGVKDALGADEVTHGFVECENGGFKVTIEPAQALQCGHTYKLVAQMGYVRSAEVDIQKPCID